MTGKNIDPTALHAALDAIEELNKTMTDENGHRWDRSDLIAQEIMAMRAIIAGTAKKKTPERLLKEALFASIEPTHQSPLYCGVSVTAMTQACAAVFYLPRDWSRDKIKAFLADPQRMNPPAINGVPAELPRVIKGFDPNMERYKLGWPQAECLIVSVQATDRAAQLAGQTLAKWIDEADGQPLSQECCEKLAHIIRSSVIEPARSILAAEEHAEAIPFPKLRQRLFDAEAKLAAIAASQPAPEPWGWHLRDLTAPPEKLGIVVRERDRLAIAQPPEEWEVTPLYAAPVGQPAQPVAVTPPDLEPVAWRHRYTIPAQDGTRIEQWGFSVTRMWPDDLPLYATPQPITVQDAARVVLISSDRGVCVGGRWDGWLMIRHHDGHWVSHHKLDAVDLRTEMTDALRAIAEGRA